MPLPSSYANARRSSVLARLNYFLPRRMSLRARRHATSILANLFLNSATQLRKLTFVRHEGSPFPLPSRACRTRSSRIRIRAYHPLIFRWAGRSRQLEVSLVVHILTRSTPAIWDVSHFEERGDVDEVLTGLWRESGWSGSEEILLALKVSVRTLLAVAT